MKEKYTVWGIPVQNMNWDYEDGGKFNPDEVYPVVDPMQNRLYGIHKANESTVSIIQSYHPTAQPRAAAAFAAMIWGVDSESWPKPNVDNRVVTCLGAPVCMACLGEGQMMTQGPANLWRVSRDQSIVDTDLYAQQLINAGDPINESLSDEHLIGRNYAVDPYEESGVKTKELIRKIISIFGPIYDVKHRTAAKPVSSFLDIRPHDDSDTDGEFANPVIKSRQTDIVSGYNRLRNS